MDVLSQLKNNQAELFESNLKVLAQKQPDIIASLTAAFQQLNSQDTHVSVVTSKTGNSTIKFNDSMLHSMYDPIKEAQRFVSNLKVDPYINVAVLGLGMGYHIDVLVGQESKRDFIIVIEKDIHVFKKFLEHKDLRNLYSRCDIYFAVGREPMEVFRALQGQSLTVFANGMTVIKHPACTKIYEDYYSVVAVKLKDIFQWARVNTISQINASKKFSANIFSNMTSYINLPGINRLFGLFNGFPGIIVSAGPSLIKNIRYLRGVQGKALLICVDTALRVLLKHGIEPDIVVSIDYTEHNARYFHGISGLKTALAVDPEVYPDIIENYDGPKFVINLPGKSLCDWLSANVEDKGGMDKGLSVAHTCFLLADRLGLSPIGLMGQDLSFPDNTTHVRGSAMVRKSNVNIKQKDTINVINIFGGKEVTTTSMHVFLRHFEDLLDQHDVKCYDLTEGGALISGSIPMPLKEFIQTRTKHEMDTKNIILNACAEPVKYNKPKLLEAVNQAVCGLNKLKQVAEEGKRLVNKMEKCVSQKSGNYNIQKLFRKWVDISKQLHSFRDVFILLGNSITDVMVLQSKKKNFDLDLLDHENPQGFLDYLAKEKTVYSRLNQESGYFIDQFNKFMKKIEPGD